MLQALLSFWPECQQQTHLFRFGRQFRFFTVQVEGAGRVLKFPLGSLQIRRLEVEWHPHYEVPVALNVLLGLWSAL